MSAATPTEKLKTFTRAFKTLTQNAVNDGVPMQNVILELDMEKFRLHAILLQRTAEREAQELATGIVAAPAGLDLGIKLNGRG